MKTVVKNRFAGMQSFAFCIASMLFFIAMNCEKQNTVADDNEPEAQQPYIIYESSACGVNDPLQNIEWLNDYYNDIKEIKDFPPFGLKLDSAYIFLYKAIEKDEHFFKINLFFPDDFYGYGYSLQWRDCTGNYLFAISYPGTPMSPELYEKYEEFVNEKEYVTKLFHFVEQ